MDKKQNTGTGTGFELLPIPQEALTTAQAGEISEIRRVWDKEEQTWYYSIIDFVKMLTHSKNPTSYWGMIKKRDQGLHETLEKLKVFSLRAKDGKLRETECATREMMLRIIQSIPSSAPLVEHAKVFLARLGEERLQEVEQQTQEEQLKEYYLRQGRTPEWIEARIRNLVGRNALTDEWLARGAQQNLHFSSLTNTIHRGTFGITTTEHHHQVKKLPKSTKKPRDHYTEDELGVLSLAELAARRRHEQNDSYGYPQLLEDAEVAGEFGKTVRLAFEEASGQAVVSSQNFLDTPKGKQKKRLPLPNQNDMIGQNQETVDPEQGTLF